MRASVTVVGLLLAAAPARPCPLCDSPTGQQVRAGIGGAVGVHLSGVAVPFAALLGVAARVHFGGPRAAPGGG